MSFFSEEMLQAKRNLSTKQSCGFRMTPGQVFVPEQNDFQLSVEGNSSLLKFGLVTLCDWLEKFAPLSQPVRGKTKTTRDLLACIFPALDAECIYLLRMPIGSLCCASVVICPSNCLWFWFYNTQVESYR